MASHAQQKAPPKGEPTNAQKAAADKLGFKRFPIDKIGLYRSADRASWPVKHCVRPMVEPPPVQPKK